MNAAAERNLPIPWFLHPYFAALLSGGSVVISSLVLKRLDPQGALRIVVALLAFPASAFLAWSFVRWIRQLDELEHRIVFHAVSFAFVGTLLAAVALGGLYRAGVL